MTMFFTQIDIYDNNKNIFVLIYNIKKVKKNAYAFFIKLLATSKQLIRRTLFAVWKSGNFSQSEHRDKFDSSPPPVCFHLLFKDPLPLHNKPRVSNRCWEHGGEPSIEGQCSSKFDWGGLSQYMGEAWRA